MVSILRDKEVPRQDRETAKPCRTRRAESPETTTPRTKSFEIVRIFERIAATNKRILREKRQTLYEISNEKSEKQNEIRCTGHRRIRRREVERDL